MYIYKSGLNIYSINDIAAIQMSNYKLLATAVFLIALTAYK